METRDKIFFGAVIVALILLFGMEWRSIYAALFSPEVGASTIPDEDMGPTHVWANVPTNRMMLPPPLMSAINKPGDVLNAGGGMFGCGGAC